MARAALSVVYSQGRDDEMSALRARVAELERSREELCWFDRLQQVKFECDHVTSYECVLDYVYDLLVWPIEQQRWGLREYVFADGVGYAPGRLSFNRDEHDVGYDLERTVTVLLADAIQNDELEHIEYYMREAEEDLGLPRGSLVRLSADAEFR